MGTVEFSSVKPNRVSQQVADQIRKMIMLEGKLKPGDKLPSERELSKVIGVGRLSLREGLRILESSGILQTRYGVRSGTYVSNIGLEHLTEKFSDILRLSDITIGQFTETRLEIGLINLKYFMERAGEEDVQRLEACVKEIEYQLKSGLQTREENIHFHQLIAEGAKNPVFILLHNALLDIWRHFLSKFDSPPEHSRKVLVAKKKILKYIKEKNFEKASFAMKNHILYSGQRIESLIEKTRKVR
ncbi:MAG: FadR/GntR family transcriptional regulator [Thermodesulfobacteriota bacterium]|nr:FadR/GntR family transcriptional regulator [Thermodesulfobacteriota bacterium]